MNSETKNGIKFLVSSLLAIIIMVFVSLFDKYVVFLSFIAVILYIVSTYYWIKLLFSR